MTKGCLDERGMVFVFSVCAFCMDAAAESLQSCTRTPWTAAHQAPPSMGFSRREYWSRVPLPSPDLEGVLSRGPGTWRVELKRRDRGFLLFCFFSHPALFSEKLKARTRIRQRKTR